MNRTGPCVDCSRPTWRAESDRLNGRNEVGLVRPDEQQGLGILQGQDGKTTQVPILLLEVVQRIGMMS